MKIHPPLPGRRSLAGVLLASTFLLALPGCVTTQAQADGSTRVNVSVAEALGLNKSVPKSPVAMAPAASQTVRAAAMAGPAGPPRARLSDKARATLVQLLECTTFKNHDFEEVVEMSDQGAWTSEVAYLDRPVTVFGLPVSKVKLEGDGSAGTFVGYFTGVTKEQIVKAANLKLSKNNKAYYYRDAKAGELSFKHAEAEVSLKCYIDTEGSYDDVPAPVKKKTKKK